MSPRRAHVGRRWREARLWGRLLAVAIPEEGNLLCARPLHQTEMVCNPRWKDRFLHFLYCPTRTKGIDKVYPIAHNANYNQDSLVGKR